MATYSFPALGFDPAPGDPDAIEAVASDCQRCASDLAAEADTLQRLHHVDWQGDAANAFAAHPSQLHHDLLQASHAHGGAGSTLAWYADALRDDQLRARRLEEEAAEARARAEGHAAEAERLARLIGTAPPGADTSDHQAQQQTAQRLQGQAEDEYQQALARARAVERAQQEAGDQAAMRIRALGDAPYHPPGLVASMVGSVTGWIDQHADLLRQVSSALKTVSAIAGLLSFIPALTPICGPIAALTAGGALAVDAALMATGHGDWKALAVDAALMALPGAGRIASRAIMSARGGSLVADDAASALALSSRQRPGTVATLVTRGFGDSAFRSTSGAKEALHPRLVEALDRIPADDRSPFHGKCAEINAVDDALSAKARLKDSVMRTMKVRPSSHPEHGASHGPCASCARVLEDFGIHWFHG